MYNNMNPNVVEAWQEAAPETAVRPWLASLLWQNGNRLWTRFVLFYRRLADMGRKNRRRLKIGLGTAALLLALSGAPTPAHAATITVGPGCTLVQAIQSANTDTSVGSCTAGSGADTIVLAGNTYSYDTAFGNDEAALPLIESEITIEANGATLQRTSGTMRILHINSGGDLTLNSATITGGNSDNRAGGILNVGTLSLNNSTIHGNTATEWGGGIYNLGGTVTINNSTISGNTGGSGGIDVSGGTVTINNSTLTGNTATNGSGGGVFVFDGTMNLNRTIISGNNGGEIAVGDWPYTEPIINANNRNLFGDSGQTNAEAFTNFPPGASDRTATSNGTHPTALADILDTTLDDNGGPTLTHALVSGSPAIDIAPTGAAGAQDQRGAGRDFDGDGVGSANEADAGAVEFRERIVLGTCGSGTMLNGAQDFNFMSGNTVTINVDTLDGLDCIGVEEMGANHLLATSSGSNDALETGNWWHISGNINSGFDVDITLPYGVANADSRVCKHPGNLGGFGWDCGDDTDNTAGTGTVTRTGVDSFSDWAVGDTVGPTAVTSLQANIITQSEPGWLVGWLVGLLGATTALFLRLRRQS